MEYGQMAEELAKIKLKELLDERHDNVEILPAGFLIDKKYGFMGASADGIIICNCCDCDTALLDIKSCYKGRDLLFKDIDKKNFFLDETKNLKRNHKYFDQVQGQMDIWSISKCYFVTYTDVDIHWEEIYYDSEFWTPRKSN